MYLKYKYIVVEKYQGHDFKDKGLRIKKNNFLIRKMSSTTNERKNINEKNNE